MTKISIVYHSGFGHTRKMAEAVLKGATTANGADVALIEITGADIVDGRWRNDDIIARLDQSDAIIFGTPTYMGSVSAPMKAFIDSTMDQFMSERWNEKIAAGFTVSSGPSGDKFNTLITLATFAMQLGMIWVGMGKSVFNDEGINRLSVYFGAAGQAGTESPEEAPNDVDKLTGEFLGRRVACIARKINSRNDHR